MEPTLALRAIETALRLTIRDVLGATWQTARGAPNVPALEERQIEDAGKRSGVLASADLLDFTETYDLTNLIEKNWSSFECVFENKARTVAYFGIIKDLRNIIAHSRDLTSFEQDLLSGISGHLRNQVALYRSSRDGSRNYYPRMESLRDRFGREAGGDSLPTPDRQRVDVGDTIDFTGSAFAARGKPVTWWVQAKKNVDTDVATTVKVATGDDVTFSYTFREADVAEDLNLWIFIVADSRYHRRNFKDLPACDDARFFMYSVNPPD